MHLFKSYKFFFFSRNYILWYLIIRVVWTIFKVCRYRNRNLAKYIDLCIVINLLVISVGTYLFKRYIYSIIYHPALGTCRLLLTISFWILNSDPFSIVDVWQSALVLRRSCSFITIIVWEVLVIEHVIILLFLFVRWSAITF